MPEKRLRILLIVFALAGLALAARLTQIQIVQADYYRAKAEQSVILAPNALPFVRGSILDRFGEVLVADRACWDLKLDFAAIAADLASDDVVEQEYRQLAANNLQLMARRLRRDRRYAHLQTRELLIDAFQADMRTMWGDFTWFSVIANGDAETDHRATAREIFERITRIRRVVADRRGFDAPIAEERLAHTLIAELNAEQQIRAREMFTRYPWVRIEPSASREFQGSNVNHERPSGEPFAHVIGRVARVTAEHLADDPERDNPFGRYEPDEWIGITGIEAAAERVLRGRRGRVIRDRDGKLIDEIEALDGADVRLTIHAELQRKLYELLEYAVLARPDSSGGAIVVLDVPTREVLALVSYPSYDPAEFAWSYPELRDDTNRLPLLFRAVGTRYAPGSTIKPMTCLAGLIHGAIQPETKEHCTGYLFDDVRDGWRCWEIHGTGIRKAHGPIDVIEALTGSCNVFMYRLSERLGIDRLTAAFDMAGVGRTTGIGLREEDVGINPTPSWLSATLNRTVTPGLPRLYSMGQGEIAMTPLQVANLMATYASGRWRPVRLFAENTPGEAALYRAMPGGFGTEENASPEWRLPGSPAAWNAIRRGIFGVTNDPTGTAYKYAHFERDGWVLSGKTGSATAHPWPTAYRIAYRDDFGQERVAIVRAGAKGPAIERFKYENPGVAFDAESVEVAARWPKNPPAEGANHAHAWFGGYLQRVQKSGGTGSPPGQAGFTGAMPPAATQPDFLREPRIAFSVLIEFGGSGGQTSGPLAKDVSSALLDVLGPNLDPDHREMTDVTQ